MMRYLFRAHKDLLLGALLVALLFFIYSPALRIYLRGDDFEWLNNSYAGWVRPAQFLTRINNFFRPTIKLSYLVNYTLFGMQSVFYNLTTIGIHLVNIALLYGLLLPVYQRRGTAWLAVLAFGLSSFYSEVTLWPAGRPDSVLLLFILLIVLTLKDAPAPLDARRKLLVASLTLGAIGSKESWILFPALIMSFLWLVQRRPFKTAASLTAILWGASGIYLVLLYGLPWLLHLPLPSSYGSTTIGASVFKASALLLTYCELGNIASEVYWQPLLASVGLIGTAAWIVTRRNMVALWGFLWLSLTVAIGLPFVHAPSRYNYLPLAGFWIMAAALLEPVYLWICRHLPLSRLIRYALLTLLVVVYSSRHIVALYLEIEDYQRHGAFHEAVVLAYQRINHPEILATKPIVFINSGRFKPLAYLAQSMRGHQKLFFVRPTVIWELIAFESLANFAGDPLNRLIMPVEKHVLSLIEHDLIVIRFTDQGFQMAPGDAALREELRRFYAAHGRLPDNVRLYCSAPTTATISCDQEASP